MAGLVVLLQAHRGSRAGVILTRVGKEGLESKSEKGTFLNVVFQLGTGAGVGAGAMLGKAGSGVVFKIGRAHV